MTKPPEKDRNWDKELAEVDRLLAKLPHADPTLGRGQPQPHKPGPIVHGAQHAAPARGPIARAEPSVAAVWIRVGLGVLAGLAMTQWPYTHVCGIKEIFYLIGASAVVASSVWGAWGAWRKRMGLAHGIAIGLLVWGTALLTAEIMPRVGSAATATWFCPEPPTARTVDDGEGRGKTVEGDQVLSAR